MLPAALLEAQQVAPLEAVFTYWRNCGSESFTDFPKGTEEVKGRIWIRAGVWRTPQAAKPQVTNNL